jgi:hypothetical protein
MAMNNSLLLGQEVSKEEQRLVTEVIIVPHNSSM